MSETRYLTRRDAAAACGCHVDTIRRAEAANRLPNRRARADGTIEIPVADLVGAGLLDPLAAGDGLPELVTRSRSERDLLDARQQVAVRDVTINELRVQLEVARDEIAFLRRLVDPRRVA